MCNLYRVEAAEAALTAHFAAHTARGVFPLEEVKPGGVGYVVRRAPDGQRHIQTLSWGFPRPQKDRTGNPLHLKPVNLCADLTNAMWDAIVPEPRYRCLIPVTALAQPAGNRGAMTRTWFSVRGTPIFAWAGFCRNTPEWGPVYAAMTTDSTDVVAALNPRMPVIVQPHEYERWLTGSIKDVIDFQFREPISSDVLLVDATSDLWVPKNQRRPQPAALL